MNRRQFISRTAQAAALCPTLLSPSRLFAVEATQHKRLGIGMHSYGFHWKAAKDGRPGAKFSDAFEFLKYARRLGAGGVQVTIGAKDSAYARKIRAEAETTGMYFEAQASLPKDKSEIARFETDARLAAEAGAEVIRAVLLGGRRYETFDSAAAFRAFREQSWQSLALAEPILGRHRLRLAVENHKDWLAAELVEILRKLGSEFIGACVDFGNNLALLENPMSVVETLAPFAFSTHIKDMAVQEYAEGFLLSEVPLGDGFLDWGKMSAVLRKANPKIQFNLEMITRDPLKVPCLTQKYWATMEDARAERLALGLALVREHVPRSALPRTAGLSGERQLSMEDENVRKSLAFAKGSLSF